MHHALTYLCVVLLELHICHNHFSLIVVFGLELLPLDVETRQRHHLTVRRLQSLTALIQTLDNPKANPRLYAACNHSQP